MSVPQPVTLMEPTPGVTSFRITAAISHANGDVIVHGQDQATGSVTHFAASEYEWFLTIPAAEKDRLLLELLAAVFAGQPDARDRMAKWLGERGIKFEGMAF
jgi:hypothetical protein